MKTTIKLCLLCIGVNLCLSACQYSWGPQVDDNTNDEIWAKVEGFWLCPESGNRYNTLEEAKDAAQSFDCRATKTGTIYRYFKSKEGKQVVEDYLYYAKDILRFTMIGGSYHVVYHKQNNYIVEFQDGSSPSGEFTIGSHVHNFIDVVDGVYIAQFNHYGKGEQYYLMQKVDDLFSLIESAYNSLKVAEGKNILILTRKIVSNNQEIISDSVYKDNVPALSCELVFDYTTQASPCIYLQSLIHSPTIYKGTYADGTFTKSKTDTFIDGYFGYYYYGVGDLYFTPHEDNVLSDSRFKIQTLTKDSLVLLCEKADDTTLTELRFDIIEERK